MAPVGLSEEEAAAAKEKFMALGVCEQLADAAAALGWKSPSSIQEQAVPLVLQGARRGAAWGPGGWRSKAANCLEGTATATARPCNIWPLLLLSWAPPHATTRPLTPIATPPPRADKDVIGLAQTGSGKTGAFALPILQVRGGQARQQWAYAAWVVAA